MLDNTYTRLVYAANGCETEVCKVSTVLFGCQKFSTSRPRHMDVIFPTTFENACSFLRGGCGGSPEKVRLCGLRFCVIVSWCWEVTTHINIYNMYNKNCMHPFVNCMYWKFRRINDSWFLIPDPWLAPSQWKTSLQSNTVSHWLGANLESALNKINVWV